MSIVIDDRIGSKHYAAMIPGSQIERLEAGDACWLGANGELVGVEVKKVPDAISCMFDGRLADHQVPLMAQLYDVRYLIIEGYYRSDPNSGVMQRWIEFESKKDVKCGRWMDVMRWDRNRKEGLMYSSFESWLSTMEILGGLRVRNTGSTESTAALLWSLHSWWQRSAHKSFNVMHDAAGNGAALSRPTMLRYMLAKLPHVGWERSSELLRRVSAVRFIAKGTGRTMKGRDWFIEGQIATKSATDIDKACEGKDDSGNSRTRSR